MIDFFLLDAEMVLTESEIHTSHENAVPKNPEALSENKSDVLTAAVNSNRKRPSKGK